MKDRPLLVMLAAGIASATGFAPLFWWPIALIAIAMLIAFVAGARSVRGAFACGWWFGLGHFTLGLNWIAHAFVFQDAMPHWLGYVAVIALALYLAIYPALAGAAAWALSPAPFRRGAFSLLLAGAWIASEFLRATLFTGFAWNPLAAITVGLPAMGYARYLGTYGLSGLVILAAGIVWWLAALAGEATRDAERRDVPHLIAALGAATVLLMLYAGFPAWPLWRAPLAGVRDGRPAIRVIQHNTSQAERHDENHDEESVRALERLTGPPGRQPRLILWPEAAVPYYLEDERWARQRLARLLGPNDVLLTGGESLVYDRQGRLIAATNSLYAMTADVRLTGRYDKAHLVPYGEYLPMRALLSAIGLSRLVPGDLDFAPGPGPRTLVLPGFGKVGGQICYEIVFSGHVIDRADRPDFIFNPSTDAWFGRWGPPQHLAQARLRAIEEGIPVIRSTPTGISAVIDADGRLIAVLPANKPGFITSALPPPHPPTAFARFGNMLPLGLALVLLAAGVAPGVALRRARR